jgi:hypothetical protein
MTNGERLEDIDLLERERVAVHLISHGAIEPDDRLMLLGLVVRPREFATAEGER